jgi:hypothetical protein
MVGISRTKCLMCLTQAPETESRFCSMNCYEAWYNSGGRMDAQIELELRAEHMLKAVNLQSMLRWHIRERAVPFCKCGESWPCSTAALIEVIVSNA